MRAVLHLEALRQGLGLPSPGKSAAAVDPRTSATDTGTEWRT